MYYDNEVKVHPSALRHGVSPDDAVFASTQYLVAVELEPSTPSRELRLGFDSAGRLLETVVLRSNDNTLFVIHAMIARRSYLDLLPKGLRP